jgi:glycosyltransferase involved in cell wall biosynthesis
MRAPGHGHIDYIAEKLAERGHKVYAWHFDLYRNEQIRRRPQKVTLIRPRTLWVHDPAAFFALNAFIQGPTMLKKIKELRINVVINENIINGLVAFLVSGTSVLRVFDFSDYFPESASINYSKSAKTMKKIVEATALAITKLNIRLAHVGLAVCNSLLQIIRTTDSKKTCYLLTNGVDNEKLLSFETSAKDSRKGSLHSSNTMVIMGVIDDWLDLITPLKAIRLLIDKIPEIKLVIIGPWRKKEQRKEIENFIENQHMDSHVEITGYISNQRLAEYLTLSRVCIMPYETKNYSSQIRLPEKLFVYSAFGKPIVSTPLPEVKALKTEHVFFYHNEQEFANLVSTILNDAGIHELSRKAKEFAQQHDFRVLAERLEQILLESRRDCPQ